MQGGSQTSDEEMQMFARYRQDSRWLMDNYGRIKREYANRYIAVKDGEIIESGDTSSQLFASLRRRREDLRTVLIEFIPPEDRILVL
ncbi:MAG: DUF5678 domain-containing protein [Candidatus Thermoplasmatota archaeon]|nr:DUF5678 domain-containing protein [Candidatus Thermoplasmatota archaeon]